jgi:hypothetical protein
MSPEEPIRESEPYIMIEGPQWGPNAEFYGRWLLAAAQADALWKEAIKDPVFEKQVERLMVIYFREHNLEASLLLFHLQENLESFIIQFDSEEGEWFAVLAEMGFFVRTSHSYQITIPTELTMETVKNAALKLAQTEDEDYVLHPEDFIATMPYAYAKAWQCRRRDMNEVGPASLH